MTIIKKEPRSPRSSRAQKHTHGARRWSCRCEIFFSPPTAGPRSAVSPAGAGETSPRPPGHTGPRPSAGGGGEGWLRRAAARPGQARKEGGEPPGRTPTSAVKEPVNTGKAPRARSQGAAHDPQPDKLLRSTPAPGPDLYQTQDEPTCRSPGRPNIKAWSSLGWDGRERP